MVRQLFSPTVRHNRNYLTISVARKTRYMYDYNLTIVEVSQTGHWQQVYMNTLHYDKSWAWFFCGIVVAILKMENGRWVGAILQSPCPSVRLSVRSHFRNRYLSFYWKKWFYIWYMALAWWLIPYLPFPGLPHIYFLFTVRLTNERVRVFLAQRSVQHLV